jgi:hypothetical protein
MIQWDDIKESVFFVGERKYRADTFLNTKGGVTQEPLTKRSCTLVHERYRAGAPLRNLWKR